jgi:hypothetical protein
VSHDINQWFREGVRDCVLPKAKTASEKHKDALAEAEALGFRRGVEASALRCENEMGDHYEMRARARWIRALLPKDSP